LKKSANPKVLKITLGLADFFVVIEPFCLRIFMTKLIFQINRFTSISLLK